ncbi:MAG: glycosyltransferase [Candidatus Roizmanbacteria bacterium]|nr:glycosyltransferase [Candidatus Roizmanbacteria bacterium]
MYNIKVDGGALTTCKANIYGTHTFSKELISALTHYDKTNSYTIYTQENSSETISNSHIQTVWPKIGWMKIGISVAEILSHNEKNIFLALNQSLPMYTNGPIIGFIHGLSFMKYPHLYPDSYKRMYRQVSQLMHRARHIVVSSNKIKAELESLYPHHNNIHSIPFGIPSAYIQKSIRYKRKNIVLFVGMNHPIKNLGLLIRSFKLIVANPQYSSYKLILAGVGNAPVNCHGLNQQNVIIIPYADTSLLLKLYNEASCLAVPSLYESFHLPTVEALSQDTPVVSCTEAAIPELAPFIHISKNNPRDFYRSLLHCLNATQHVDIQKLRATFSWKIFVNKIVALYHD